MDQDLATERLEIRLTPTEKAYLNDAAKKKGLTITDYIKVSSIHRPKTNTEMHKLYKEIMRSKKLRVKQILNRRESYMLYVDKNGLRRVLEAARFSQFHTGKIDMIEIRRLINNIKEMYELFPDDIKTIKRGAMLELENCKDKNYLMQKLKTTVKQMEQVKEKHEKMIQGSSLKTIIDYSEKNVQKKKEVQN